MKYGIKKFSPEGAWEGMLVATRRIEAEEVISDAAGISLPLSNRLRRPLKEAKHFSLMEELIEDTGR